MIDLKRYVAPFSVSGNEEGLASVIEKDMAPFSDTVTYDAMGNLICYKKGENPETRLMLAAHMDEIGFVVTYIENSGLIRVANVGGVKPMGAAFGEVVFQNGVKGVLVFEENVKPADLAVKHLAVDIGAKNKKDAEKKVAIGMALSLSQRVTRLANRRFAAKAFDDRIGCAALVEAAKLAGKPKYDTYFVFTVQEEVGLRGAKAAAAAILPHYALACDLTPANDAPGSHPGAVTLGGGAAVKIKDSSVICSKLMVRRLADLAEKRKIKYQYEVLLAGGTDTASMQTAGAGSHAGCVSIPARYVHSPVEVIDYKDLENTALLLAAFIEEGI